jgi:pimeloyl-ACP methyl ester carboxylesterase
MDRRTFTASCLRIAARAIGVVIAGRMLVSPRAGAQDVDQETSTGNINAVLPTLGGKQFWADELFFHDWHIQRNVFTDHCRLLDGHHLRHAWGSFDECRNKLEIIKRERHLPPMHGKAVIVLHGLFRTPTSMNRLCRYLREHGGYTVFNVSYPTTRGSVADHARTLAKIIDCLEGIDELNFVGHSLGNLVVRHYLADRTQPEVGLAPDARIKRIVMLGPPNQGAQIAEALGGVGLFHTVAGASASQLASQWDELEAHLATPACEFGILAGGRTAAKGYNPLLEGDNDFVVSVQTTQLPGAADFAVLPVIHSLMMDDARVHEYTLRFLQHGYFVSPEARHPLVADDVHLAREPSGAGRKD